MSIQKMTDLDLRGKSVVIREDLNVPIIGGKITNDKRIRAALPTMQYVLDQGAGIIVLSHLGRPKEGEFDEQNSLAPVAARLSDCLEVFITKDICIQTNLSAMAYRHNMYGIYKEKEILCIYQLRKRIILN